jgi:hypothetical protein
MGFDAHDSAARRTLFRLHPVVAMPEPSLFVTTASDRLQS